MEFNIFLDYYKNAKDLNVSESGREERNSRNSNVQGFTRFYIGIGQKQKLKVPNLIGLINEVTKKRDIEIGKIEILRNFSFFEADSEFEKLILDSFAGEDVDVQISNPEKKERRGDDRNDRRKGDRKRSGGGGYSGKSGGGYSGKSSGGKRSGGGYSKSGSGKSDFGGGRKGGRSGGRSGSGRKR